jgi:hypothetical protein
MSGLGFQIMNLVFAYVLGIAIASLSSMHRCQMGTDRTVGYIGQHCEGNLSVEHWTLQCTT